MSLSDQEIERCAAALFEAERTCTPIAPLTDEHPELTPAAAYAIQDCGLAMRGTTLDGYKLGFTSAAMREQMGVPTPNYGALRQGTRVFSTLPASTLIHPLLEPEIALQLGADIPVGGEYQAADMAQYIAAVSIAMEIVDTRYLAYRFRPEDNIADNSSAARYLLGDPLPLTSCGDLGDVEIALTGNGDLLGSGRGSEALGSPLAALAWLAGVLDEHGKRLTAGMVILTGGLTRAHPLAAGDEMVARCAQLGDLVLRVV